MTAQKALALDSLRVYKYTMPLKRADGTSRDRTRSSINFLVHVVGCWNGATYEGWGECQPRHVLSGDGENDRGSDWSFLCRAVDSLAEANLVVTTPDDAVESVRAVMTHLEAIAREEAAGTPGSKPFREALFAIDVALLDAASRSLDLRLSQLLGERREEIAITTSTISRTTPSTTVAEKASKQKRFPMSRVKGGGDVAQNLTLLREIAAGNRDAGRCKPLWIDINETMDLQTASGLIRAAVTDMSAGTLPTQLVIEDPLPKENAVQHADLQRIADEAIAELTDTTDLSIAVMTDASTWASHDLEALNARGGCRAISIKAPKAGGLLASLDLANAAVEADPDVQICIGGVLGSGELPTWALHNLGRAMPRLDYMNAVPPRNVVESVAFPRSQYASPASNVIAPQIGAGLGATVAFESLQRYLDDEYGNRPDAEQSVADEADGTTQQHAKEQSWRLLLDGPAIQNVGYRRWLRRRARAYGLSGWVRNRSDGQVEALIRGNPPPLDGLMAEAPIGPSDARVEQFNSWEVSTVPKPGFRIRETREVNEQAEGTETAHAQSALARRYPNIATALRRIRQQLNRVKDVFRRTPVDSSLNQLSSIAEIHRLDDRLSTLTRESLRHYVPARREVENVVQRKAQAQAILDVVSPQHVQHRILRRIERNDLKIRRGLSFKACMIQESESRRLKLTAPSWVLDQKIVAYRFIDELDIRRPQTDLNTYRFDDLPMMTPAVVKPRRGTGAQGCYLVYSPNNIVHVRDGVTFSSWEEVRQHAKGLMNPSPGERRLPNRWFVEELILEDRSAATPARDLKYFCFYGEVLFFLEVRRHEGQAEYSFRMPDHTPIFPGDWDYNYFEGDGTKEGDLDLVKEISSQIPHPFCRIDMLKGGDGLVLGEFTPRPGDYEQFSPEWDRLMGEAWTRAQHRIQRDLLSGKRFDSFLRATEMLNEH